jgi:hypothetical protein
MQFPSGLRAVTFAAGETFPEKHEKHEKHEKPYTKHEKNSTSEGWHSKKQEKMKSD